MERSAGGGGGGFTTLKVLPLLHAASRDIVAANSSKRIHRLVATAVLPKNSVVLPASKSCPILTQSSQTLLSSSVQKHSLRHIAWCRRVIDGESSRVISR